CLTSCFQDESFLSHRGTCTFSVSSVDGSIWRNQIVMCSPKTSLVPVQQFRSNGSEFIWCNSQFHRPAPRNVSITLMVHNGQFTYKDHFLPHGLLVPILGCGIVYGCRKYKDKGFS